MKQFVILFAAVCAMTFMTGQADAQCGGGYGGGFGGYSAPVYRSSYRPVYGGGFGGFGRSGISINVGRSFGGRGFSRGGFSRGGFSRGGFRF